MEDQTPRPPDLSEQLAALERERDEARDALAAARATSAAAITAVRDTLRAANPTIPPDMIDGDSVDALTASVERARAFAAQVLERHTTTHGNGGPPAVPRGGGAPAPIDYSKLHPHERMRIGFEQRRSAAGG
jgi:hypothetical protein